MKRFINMGSIKAFRNVVKDLGHQARFQGLDEDGNPIYREVKLPTLVATGSEKVHGTNAAVCFSKPDGFWVQSRKNIITPEKDNAGCAFQVMAVQAGWMEIVFDLADEYNINLDEEIITVYFEWAGGNIQKNACLSGLDKRAVIFRYFKVSPSERQTDSNGEEVAARWIETKVNEKWVDNTEKNIFNIMNFPTVEVEIDFNNPGEAQNEMIKLVEEMEDNSPMGKSFGIDGNILEGFVFTVIFDGQRYVWKVKGEKHSKGSGKVKTLKPVDTEAEKKKADFVNDVACQEFRLDQMFTEIQNSKYNGDVMQMSNKDIGDYIRLVIKDVIKEHTEDLVEAGLEPKSINGMVSKVAKIYFMDRLDKEQM